MIGLCGVSLGWLTVEQMVNDEVKNRYSRGSSGQLDCRERLWQESTNFEDDSYLKQRYQGFLRPSTCQ